ncbi:MAG: hypothetical protein ACLSCV_07575 [Acutalibacteraceae bacterium]
MQLTALQPKVWWRNYYFKAFVYGIGISFLFFIPFIIYDKGYFFYGDFNVQQVPFYQMAHDAVRSGSFAGAGQQTSVPILLVPIHFIY